MPTTRRRFIKTGAMIMLGLASADAFWAERFFIETKEFYLGRATKSTKNLKIVQVSDLHLRSINYLLSRLARHLNNLNPDLILITGDAIDNVENKQLLNDFLAMVNKHIPKASILGNWEHWSGINLTELEKIYQQNNCTLLINNTVQYTIQDKKISITGVDDFIAGQPDIKLALTGYKTSDHHIILNHCPQYSDQISAVVDVNTPVDVILSGHTHGGQVNLFGFRPYLPNGSGKYVKGWYNYNYTKMYVSKGIGTTIFPVRFMARAEIAIFNLLV